MDPYLDPLTAARSASASTLCALLMLRAALLRHDGCIERSAEPGVVSVLQVPDKAWGCSVAAAWTMIFNASTMTDEVPSDDPVSEAARRRIARSRGSVQGTGRAAEEILALERSTRALDPIALFRSAVRSRRAIHAISQDPERLLPSELLITEEQRLVVEPLDGTILGTLATCLRSEDGWPRGRRPRVPLVLAAAIRTMPPFLLDLAHRGGQDPKVYLRRLATIVARRDTPRSPARDRSDVTLDDLPGMGAAGVWAQRAAADLRAYAKGAIAWSEMDRGVVLEGPPGTGKSTFARALANSAGVPLVSSSLAQWQGDRDGHLGTLLGAMRRTFDEARGKAPCVLLIDEIDAFPSRASVMHRHRDYVVQVVYGLLEQLDGAVDRPGVLVIGTCNDAGNLDPAVTRAGRLEPVIRLGKPDVEGLEGILRVHLGGALRGAGLRPLAQVAHRRGAVGADVERWVRDARRRARVAGRPMILADLVSEIGDPPAVHGREALRRAAVHEAGHVLAFALMGEAVLERVVVDPFVGGNSATMVDTIVLVREVPHPTRSHVKAQLRATLAGRAAEEVILGEPSGGAGGSRGSDLARATRLVCAIVASSGLDLHPDALVFLCEASDHDRLERLLLLPDVRRRAADLLHAAYVEALDLVRQHRVGVERVADAFLKRGSLTGAEAVALLGDILSGENASANGNDASRETAE